MAVGPSPLQLLSNDSPTDAMGNCLSRLCSDGAADSTAEDPLLKDSAAHASENKTKSKSTVSRSVAYYSGSASQSLLDFELLAFIGQGSFAEVTLARHRNSRELFAIKKISKQRVKDEGSVERTFTERHILASLRHPFLVRLYQAFQSPTHLYLVLEFANGGDFRSLMNRFFVHDMYNDLQCPHLGAHLLQECSATYRHARSRTLGPVDAPDASSSILVARQSGGRMPLDHILFYGIEVALALTFLHSKGFVYRDLKPENILLRGDGHIMLTDFGVAKQCKSCMQPTPAKLLTPDSKPSTVRNASLEGRGLPASVQQRGLSSRAGTPSSTPALGEFPDTDSTSRKNSFAGTQQYMSPEMLQGSANGNATDWWSFGVWLFEMANGRRPFEADNEYVLYQSIVEQDIVFSDNDFHAPSMEFSVKQRDMCSSDVLTDAVGQLADLVRRLLCRDPHQRLGGASVLTHRFFHLACWRSHFKNHAEVDRASWLRCFTEKSIAPPYTPVLRGADDLHYFPCAVAATSAASVRSSGTLRHNATQQSSQRYLSVRGSGHQPLAAPSEELFEFMLRVDGDDESLVPSDDPATRTSQRSLRSAGACLYYEQVAKPSDHVDLPEAQTEQASSRLATEVVATHEATASLHHQDSASFSRGGLNTTLQGVAYEEAGVHETMAADHMDAGSSSERLFDGFTVAQFHLSRNPSLAGQVTSNIKGQDVMYEGFTYQSTNSNATNGSVFLNQGQS